MGLAGATVGVSVPPPPTPQAGTKPPTARIAKVRMPGTHQAGRVVMPARRKWRTVASEDRSHTTPEHETAVVRSRARGDSIHATARVHRKCRLDSPPPTSCSVFETEHSECPMTQGVAGTAPARGIFFQD